MRLAVLLFAIVISVASSFAVGPTTMTYQAIFTNNSGEIMPDGVYNIGFHIFESPVGGPPLWSEWQDVTVTNGLFETSLGVINPLGVAQFVDALGDGTWLGLSYNEDFLNPRQFITGVPYAFIACYADSARTSGNSATGGYTEDQFPDDEISNDDLVLETSQFTVTANSAVTFFATTTVESDNNNGTNYRGRLDLFTSDGSLVASTPEVKQISPADLFMQALSTPIAPGNYFLRLTLWTTDGEATVWLEGTDFGVSWVPNLSVPTVSR